MFRNDRQLRGIATGTLPAEPELLWKFDTGGPVRSTAAIVGDRVFIGSNDGFLYALDKATGKEIWKFETEDSIEAAPLYRNGTLYFGSADSFFYAVDAETGKEKWKYETWDKILGAANWIS
ncbi:MAG: PQQ-binding-like beta-propeller repeat protein, partial [Candidatus Omnitrophica bacterium]|nr:PQQ-binding-like beta-propeller repeat protein [Candidatus Omnitrophota bacterium]